MQVYRCPVCKKKLTKKQYGKALGILEEKEKHQKHQLDDLTRKLKTAERNVKNARQEGRDFERKKSMRMLQGQVKKIENLKKRIKQLERGKTPQTEGLEFEENLVKRLRKEFPKDKIEHKGKGGDIIQIVMFQHQQAGVIVYECKRTPTLKSNHVEQAYQAKITRKADFAVLVTTAHPTRKWKGFGTIKDVSVVSPFAVIPLISHLRMHLIEMLKAKIPMQKRAKIAHQLLEHITSPDFRNTLEEIVRTGKQLQLDLVGEMKLHRKVWEKRWNSYQKIHFNGALIHDNLQLVLQGRHVKSLIKPKVQPLPLPSP